MNRISMSFGLAWLVLASVGAQAQALSYPATERRPVIDTLHGTTAAEDYRWLEDGADPAVKDWGQAQLQLTRGVLDALPLRAELKARFKQLRETSPVRYYGLEWRGGLFAMKRKPPLNQPRLVWLRSPDDVATERVIVDPNVHQQVWHHRLGTPSAQDRYAVGRGFPRIAETMLSASRDGRWVLASVNNGDGGDVAFWLKNPAGVWARIADHADNIRSMAFGPKGLLYAVSRQDALRGKIVTVPLRRPEVSKAKLLVPESDVTIDAVTPARTCLYVEAMAGGPSQLRVYDLAGQMLPEIPTAPVSSAMVGVRLEGYEVLVGSESFVTLFAWSRYVPATRIAERGRLTATAPGGKANFDFDDAVAVRENMLRVELTPNGAFNVTEFGSVADPQQFAALYAYSPYHRVVDGTAYPAVLLTTGENDGRVDPYNSRKMAARLQAANPAGRPVLLRTSADTGHGMGTGMSAQIELDADVYTFLMGQLGMR